MDNLLRVLPEGENVVPYAMGTNFIAIFAPFVFEALLLLLLLLRSGISALRVA